MDLVVFVEFANAFSGNFAVKVYYAFEDFANFFAQLGVAVKGHCVKARYALRGKYIHKGKLVHRLSVVIGQNPKSEHWFWRWVGIVHADENKVFATLMSEKVGFVIVAGGRYNVVRKVGDVYGRLSIATAPYRAQNVVRVLTKASAKFCEFFFDVAIGIGTKVNVVFFVFCIYVITAF